VKRKTLSELSRVRTSGGLNTIPKHGKDDPGHDVEIAEPEAERRSVKDREGYVEFCTDGPIGDDDESDEKVSKGYRRKYLSPEIPSSTPSPARDSEESDTYKLNPIASIELASL